MNDEQVLLVTMWDYVCNLYPINAIESGCMTLTKTACGSSGSTSTIASTCSSAYASKWLRHQAAYGVENADHAVHDEVQKLNSGDASHFTSYELEGSESTEPQKCIPRPGHMDRRCVAHHCRFKRSGVCTCYGFVVLFEASQLSDKRKQMFVELLDAIAVLSLRLRCEAIP